MLTACQRWKNHSNKTKSGLIDFVINDPRFHSTTNLKDRDKQLIRYHLIDNKTFSEISKILRVTPARVWELFYRSMEMVEKLADGWENPSPDSSVEHSFLYWKWRLQRRGYKTFRDLDGVSKNALKKQCDLSYGALSQIERFLKEMKIELTD